MSWYRPRNLLLTILMMALVAGGVLVALPYLVSTDLIRARLIQEISNWNGYTVNPASRHRYRSFLFSVHRWVM